MKKLLSILGTISLSTIISTNIISCKKPNTNNKQIKQKFISQQPPANSNGKLVKDDNRRSEFSEPNNEGYFYILFNVEYICERVYFDSDFIENHNTHGQHLKYGINFPVYHGDGNGEPKIPRINTNTGEIRDGNEKIES